MIKIGDAIPDLTLDAYYQDKFKRIKLSSFKGKWLVMLFYPADFTFVCPTELEEAAENYKKFKQIDAEIVSISTDTHFSHKAWHDSSKAINKIKFPMLADPTGTVCKKFGTYIKEEGLSLRGTFIVDPDQKVIGFDIHSNDIGRSIEEILRKLQAAKFVRDHKGTLVCPASWKPGRKTLKPGVDLVGKI